MIKSRRSFLQTLGVGAAAGAAVRWPLGDVSALAAASPRGAQSDGFIRLDSNENAYGPSPKVASAIRSATGMANRYPFRKYDEITAQIAHSHGVKPEQVLFGCGSSRTL